MKRNMYVVLYYYKKILFVKSQIPGYFKAKFSSCKKCYKDSFYRTMHLAKIACHKKFY